MAVKTEVMSLRLEPDVAEALEAAARKERRPKNNMVSWMILDYAKRIEVYRDPEERAPASKGKGEEDGMNAERKPRRRVGR